ncbi:MAG: glycosyltransferase family 4 protein [Thermoplasmata archaeon]|nr:glycosyltransferase family 4 protein [Thermoplasmata archaeon]
MDPVSPESGRRPRVGVLLRNLWAGSFARHAIEEVSWLRDREGFAASLIPFDVSGNGYHYDDLIQKNGIDVRLPYRRPRWTRLLRRLFLSLTPPIRGVESSIPVVEILLWAVTGRAAFDVLYAEDQFVGAGAYLRNRLRGTPYVLYVAEPVSDLEGVQNLRIGRHRIVARLLARLLRRLESRILLGACERVFVSMRTRKAIEARFPAVVGRPGVVQAPGCHPVEGPPPSRSSDRYLLSASKWDAGRNPGFAVTLAADSGIPVVLAGTWLDAETESAIRREAATAHEKNGAQITITGPVTQDKMDQLFQGAYAYLQWTAEGFAMGVLEAMASGIPVICTRDAGASELILDGREGLLLPRGSVDEFVAAARGLLADPVRRDRMASAALETSRHHDWASHNRVVAEVLTRALLPRSVR